MERSVSCVIAPNIALIKYWGKRDKKLNLPLNSSISLTLSSDALYTKTTARFSSDSSIDVFSLNGKILKDSPRVNNMITQFRDLVRQKGGKDAERLANCRVTIESHNNFPTKAGMASSASGYACLALCLSKLYGVLDKEEERGALSAIARQASGSACRSLFEGLVRWNRGESATGSDSIAEQICPPEEWPELRVCICILSTGEKSIGSTEGMNKCVESSEKMKQRTPQLVESRIAQVIEAYKAHDFNKLAPLIMQDSDDLEAICLDVKLTYQNEGSQEVKRAVKELNTRYTIDAKNPNYIAAYSFDAGPNAFVFYESKNAGLVEGALRGFNPSTVLHIGVPSVCGKHLFSTRERADSLIFSAVGEEPRFLFVCLPQTSQSYENHDKKRELFVCRESVSLSSGLLHTHTLLLRELKQSRHCRKNHLLLGGVAVT